MHALALAALFSLAAPAEPCAVLEGNAEQREANEERREEAIVDVEAEADVVRIVHQDSRLSRPVSTRLSSLKLETAEIGSAEIALPEAMREMCGETATLSVDDSVGKSLQVVYVDDDGVLLLGDEELIWWSEEGEVPEFRMVWRSPFSLEVTDGKKKSSKRKPRRSSKKKKKSRR